MMFGVKALKASSRAFNVFHPIAHMAPACSCPYSTETTKGSKTVTFDCSNCTNNASLTNPHCRARLAEIAEMEKPDEVVLRKRFQRVYGPADVRTAHELAKATESAKLALDDLTNSFCEKCTQQHLRLLKNVEDPIRLYYMLRTVRLCKVCDEQHGPALDILSKQLFEVPAIRTALKIGDPAAAWHRLFRPVLIPELISSKVDRHPPDTPPVETYNIGAARVSICPSADRPDHLYHIDYPEFMLSNPQLKALQAAFVVVTKEQPDIEHSAVEMRKLLARLADKLLGAHDPVLKEIFLRHTAGYGLLEPLLADTHLTDIYVDSGSRMVHVVHAKLGECITNIHLSSEDLEKLSTRLRAVSGRPFDASSPVLHAELEDFGVRVAGIREPCTYSGTGFAFRRRKETPWTLGDFMRVGMLSPEAAGLLSFLMDGHASLLVVGPRSSGKTSLMTSLLLEVNQNNRIILIEDTPETPVAYLRGLGYKLEHLKIEAFAKGYELSAEDALRTSLRLGESILVLGEVRGQEAKALFEAMRVGAVGNVVIGTVHGSSPYDVWDRITNDLGVPSTSFKAADIILTTGLMRKGDSPERLRRLTGITEVLKDWHDEPKFRELMTYRRGRDSLKIEDLWQSDTIRRIAQLKGFSKKQALDNIKARIDMRKALLKAAQKRPELLSAEWTVAANNAWLNAVKARKRTDYTKALASWKDWLESAMG